ncbi:MAG: pyrimidine/purine nucleoside phosphorylase [Desulfuromonadales bacterium]|nr:pyrimidine/purine nucleoside phosphorylase [Desulfuromonadales bacterium]
MSRIPEQLDQVSIVCKANIYFDGRVVSHTIHFPDASKKTLGLIYPGSYSFTTAAAERMEIVAGNCRARVAGAADWTTYAAGDLFDVPANASFEIAVEQGIAEYLCSFADQG